MLAAKQALCRISRRHETGQVRARIRGETNLQRYAGDDQRYAGEQKTENRAERQVQPRTIPEVPGRALTHAIKCGTIKIEPAIVAKACLSVASGQHCTLHGS